MEEGFYGRAPKCRLVTRPRLCLECSYWYGAEDDEFGPCSLKHQRNTPKFLTFGTHDCDEGFTEEGARPDHVDGPTA